LPVGDHLEFSDEDAEDDDGSDMSYEVDPLDLPPLQLDNFSTQLNLQATIFTGADHQVVNLVRAAFETQRQGRFADAALGSCLSLLHQFLPHPNHVPTMRQLHHVLDLALADGTELSSVCPDDHVIFRDEPRRGWAYAKLDRCPQCGKPRWRGGVGSGRVAVKLFIFYPMAHCVRALYADPKTAAKLILHPLTVDPTDITQTDIKQSVGWKVTTLPRSLAHTHTHTHTHI